MLLNSDRSSNTEIVGFRGSTQSTGRFLSTILCSLILMNFRGLSKILIASVVEGHDRSICGLLTLLTQFFSRKSFVQVHFSFVERRI
jgi:hypothetical protein